MINSFDIPFTCSDELYSISNSTDFGDYIITPYDSHPILEILENDSKDFVNVEISTQETIFNRLQWYHITLKFKDQLGKPVFNAYKIVFDPSITFLDGRKTSMCSTEKNDLKTISLNFIGMCSDTQNLLIKCQRCVHKDKELTKRKRKSNTNTKWSELDDKNNAKLIQVLTGDEYVNELGELKFRLRIGCCVGVNKQHHMNHINNESNIKRIHKSCSGLKLKLIMNFADKTQESLLNNIEPIRVLGKVTKENNSKKRKQDEDEVEVVIDVPKTIVEEKHKALYIQIQNQYNFDPGAILHKISKAYHVKWGLVFEHPCPDVYAPCYFLSSNTNALDPKSPLMFEIFTTIGCGSAVYDLLLTEKYFTLASKMVPTLMEKSNNISDKDCLYLADGLNRLSMYYGAKGNIPEAKNINYKAREIIDKLYYRGFLNIYESGVYENIMWTSISFDMDVEKIKFGIEWAESRNRYDSKTYFLFLLIIITISPEIHDYAKYGKGYLKILQLSEFQINVLKSLIVELEDSLKKAGHYFSTDGKRSYNYIINQGINSLKAWVYGDIALASKIICIILYNII
jgi:hypothetical protein